MPLFSGDVLLRKAKEEKFGIGAFNFNNLEFFQAILDAAKEMRSPVIFQVSEGGMKYMGISFLEGIIKSVLCRVEIPVAIHLDHGSSLNAVLTAIRAGFTSVMIDASSKPFEENVRITQEVVKIAHSVGVSVEAELGRIVGTEEHVRVSDKEELFTDPDEAARFVELTNVDSLAIAIGTAHGVYKGEPKLDFDRLCDIKRKVDIPLVLHGASGVPLEDLKKAISLGICKINIDTDLRLAFRNKLEEMIYLKKGEIDPRKFLGPARDAVKEVVKEKIRAFGSEGRL